MDFYKVVYSSPETITLGNYLGNPICPAFKYNGREDEFLAVTFEGVTNRERIIRRYLDTDDINSQKLETKYLNIVFGTELVIPFGEIAKEGLLTQGIEVVSNNSAAFKAEALAKLESDNGYVQLFRNNSEGSIILEQHYPDITVWIWSRVLNQIIDVSPFIQKVSTSMGKNGGAFQMTLPPITCEMINGKWEIKKSSFYTYINQKSGKTDFLSDNSLYQINTTIGESVFQRSNFLFHNILSSNDLVFIRLETLKSEENDRKNDSFNFIIDKKDLSGKIYDLIGLIDINEKSLTPESTDVSIDISGRDLSKLFIEDGTYFYPLENSQGKLNFAGESTLRNSLVQRVFTNNTLTYLSLFNHQPIDHILKFVIQQLSTIKVVPDDLFTSYIEEIDGKKVDRRNTVFNEDKNSRDQFSKITQREFTYKKEAEDAISRLRISLGIENINQEQEKKIQIDIYKKLYNFLSIIRNNGQRKPDLNGNVTITVGWNGGWTYTQISGVAETVEEDKFSIELEGLVYLLGQPLDDNLDDAVKAIDKVIDVQKSQSEYITPIKTTPDLARGIWQIIKLIIDESVSNRKLVDSSMSSASGSLLNFIRKCCQEPFVEFMMDTYGDMYYLTVRKQPYDKSGLVSLLEKKIETEVGSKSTPYSIIEIDDNSVLNESLQFNDNEVYSWYHFTPQANFIGNGSNFSLAYIPAIYFEEYADIWGSKPYQLVHNYLPGVNTSESFNADKIIVQTLLDLTFMIESTAYLPFTRSGTITVNRDRRLKIGNIIRYKPTGEIFFIDAVSHSYNITTNSIDHTTTLTVSRGMIEKFIKGVPLNQLDNTEKNSNDVISYFNIINTDLKFFTTTDSDSTIDVSEKLSNVKVNKKVFDFFLKRKQLNYR